MIKNLRHAITAAAAALALLVTLQSPGRADDARVLRLNVGLPPTHTWVKAYKFLAENLPKATNGTLKADEYYGTLLNFKETVPGIRDGVADIGLAVIGYYPAEFRNTNLVGELAMLGQDGISMTGAVSEYIFNCKPCLEEFKRFNQVYLGTAVAPVYRLFTTQPVKSVDDLKGLKVRSGAGVYTRWAEHFGASPSSLSADEVYEGMSQGIINANVHPVTELINLSLADVAKYVTEIPLGTYNAVSVYSVNRDVWKSLTNEQRAALLDLTARGNAHVAVAYEEDNRAAKQKAMDLGVTFVQPDADLLKAQRDFADNDAKSVAKVMETNYGLTNVQANVDQFTQLVDKWQKLTADIGVNEDELAKLLQDQIWSKLDPSTYPE